MTAAIYSQTPPGYTITFFTNMIRVEARIHRANANIVSELTAIATALSTDTAVKDTTQQTAPLGLRPGIGMNPGVAARSRFINDVLLHVNAGKASGLTPAAMGTAITAALTNILAPVNTAAPVVSGVGTVGQNLTTTNGTWSNVPVAFTYQWLRNGVAILGAINSVYALVGADSTRSVSCQVRAENAAGANTANSNAIAVA